MARPTGFEPVASTFGGWHSIQLSYGRLGNRIITGRPSPLVSKLRMTFASGGVRSIQLSYGRLRNLIVSG